MKSIARSLLLLVFLFASVGEARACATSEDSAAEEGFQPMMLCLRDGSTLWGSIRGHSPEELEFLRVDTGGVVKLPWERLDPNQDLELRTQFGYVDSETEELMIAAERIPVVGGGDIVGVIDRTRTGDALWVKTATGLLPLPKDRIAGPPTTVQWPALEIYTREELYQRKLLEHGEALAGENPETAEVHWEIAEYCVRSLDFSNALKHYAKIAEWNPEFRDGELQVVLERTRTKAENQEQLDYLQNIDRLRRRERFGDAFLQLDEFDVLWPNSPVRADAVKLRGLTERSQARYLNERVVQSWHRAVDKVAEEYVKDSSFQSALGFAEEEMSAQVLQRVHSELTDRAPDVTPEVVKQMFLAREGGRWRSAGYGLGTWMLGKEKAELGLQTEEEKKRLEQEAARMTTRDKEREAVRDRLRRFLEVQKLTTRDEGVNPEEDPEKFWETYQRRQRVAWLKAYYVENSGDFAAEGKSRVRARSCPTCGGDGVLEEIQSGSASSRRPNDRRGRSGVFLKRCHTCHGVRVFRRIQYR